MSAAAPFTLVIAAHYLWRHAYYGAWLPNTPHAKYVRPWYGAGVEYLASAALETGAYLWVPLALVAPGTASVHAPAGGRENVGVRLLDASGAPVAAWTAPDNTCLDLVLHPLEELAGRTLVLEVFDDAAGAGGHVMIDHALLVAGE